MDTFGTVFDAQSLALNWGGHVRHAFSEDMSKRRRDLQLLVYYHVFVSTLLLVFAVTHLMVSLLAQRASQSWAFLMACTVPLRRTFSRLLRRLTGQRRRRNSMWAPFLNQPLPSSAKSRGGRSRCHRSLRQYQGPISVLFLNPGGVNVKTEGESAEVRLGGLEHGPTFVTPRLWVQILYILLNICSNLLVSQFLLPPNSHIYLSI